MKASALLLLAWAFLSGCAHRAEPPVAVEAAPALEPPAATAPRAELPKAPVSDIDEPPPSQVAERGRAYAVVIGVRAFRRPLPPAEFADADARLFARYLTRVFGYPEDNIALLVDEQATRSAVEDRIERWLPERAEQEGEVFVYFAGRGAPNPASGEAYLLPYDGDPSALAGTAYPLERLYEQLGRLPAKSVSVVLDAGFSGEGDRSLRATGAELSALKSRPAPLNAAVLRAAAPEETSRAYPEKRHGLFTYFLLKGLSKQAYPDLRAAFDYAAPEVSLAARRYYNGDQNPQWTGSSKAR